MSETIDIQAFLARANASRSSHLVGGGAGTVVALAEARARLPEPGPEAATAPAARWSCGQLAGRLVELSGRGAVASLTAAVGLILEAQQQGDPAAWVGLPATTFYPPDLADSGVDLDALIVVRTPTVGVAARAAERLLRSGGFGLVILDLGKDAELPMAMQGRLVSLAQHHDAAVVCVTDKPADSPSLGSLISLRAEALRSRAPGIGGGFTCTVRALKDKRRGPGWSQPEVVTGPPGLA